MVFLGLEEANLLRSNFSPALSVTIARRESGRFWTKLLFRPNLCLGSLFSMFTLATFTLYRALSAFLTSTFVASLWTTNVYLFSPVFLTLFSVRTGFMSTCEMFISGL